MSLELDKIYLGDCLELMPQIQDQSIDAVICDLPYGTTDCAWDSVIPLDKLWAEYHRICKPSAVILLFGSEPFSSKLRMSNLKEWRYDWIWHKNSSAGFIHAHNRPLKDYEIVSSFCQYGMGHETTMGGRRMPYNPQGLIRDYKVCKWKKRDKDSLIGGRPAQDRQTIKEWTNYPHTTLHFNKEGDAWHPTQKPVDLLRYLVLTYTNEGDTVLDNCMGSGTTAIACIKEKRHFIGFEINKDYYESACKRIEWERRQLKLF